MGRGDVKAARAVLKGAGVFAGDAARIAGSGDPDGVRNEQVRKAKIQELNDLLLGTEGVRRAGVAPGCATQKRGR